MFHGPCSLLDTLGFCMVFLLSFHNQCHIHARLTRDCVLLLVALICEYNTHAKPRFACGLLLNTLEFLV